jgi:DNA topoisomerase-1
MPVIARTRSNKPRKSRSRKPAAAEAKAAASPPPAEAVAPTKDELVQESIQAAKAAELRYVSDEQPGIRRVKAGKGFKYVMPDGKPLSDPDTEIRIKAMAIPPAWTEVWICPHSNGHIQAVGRDDRGRKQYRYHARWREVRDQAKYDKMISFAQALPTIRRRTEADLAKPGLPREKVLGAVVRIMEKTLIRVGNDEYANNNDSYGLTTLQDHHAEVDGHKVSFEFKGKSGKEHEIDLEDKRLARIVEHCQDLPGEELFQYVDEQGATRDIGSSDVNDYLREITGENFTAKDFRTWAGTVLAARALREFKAFDSKAEAKRNVVKAIENVAKRLGNTKAVCRKCYIHPAILNDYMDGSLLDSLSRKAGGELAAAVKKLPAEEAAVLGLLQQSLKRDADAAKAGRKGRSRSRR